MTAASLSETLDELNALCQFFVDAEKSLKNGKMADLSGIDVRVNTVCKIVQESIPEQQKEFLPELTVLINLLNVYEDNLKNWHNSLSEAQEKEHA